MGNVSSQSIILNFTKYSETSIIVNCYSLLNGYSSHIVKGVRSKKKSRFKLGHFQRLNLVEIENGNIRGNELSYLKNIKIISTYNSINSDVIKFNIAAFLSEILSMILKNHNADRKLFDFLKSSFEWFEKSENYSSFHVLFMVYITKFLGIYPEKNINNHLFFDLENGCFSDNRDSTTCISGQVTNDLSLILGTQFDYSNDVLYNVTRRREMIDLMLKYYMIHLPGFKIPKSLEILNELFS